MRKALLGAVCASAILGVMPSASRAGVVEMGTDFFTTWPGTFFNFAGIGPVSFLGNPVGPGGADTEVQRLSDVTLSGGSTRLKMTLLSLTSVAPVNIGGFLYDINVGLNPNKASKGKMRIFGTTAGGTFNSHLRVNFDATFTPVNGGPAIPTQPGTAQLSQAGGRWSPTPPPGAVIVSGPDSPIEGSPADLPFNMHTGLDPGEVDFFPANLLTERKPKGGQHVVALAGLNAVGDLVFVPEGANGTSVFTVFNSGSTSATISGITVTQDKTQGDESDFADMVLPLGGTCSAGLTLGVHGACTVAVNFTTDAADSGPRFDGTTPFELLVTFANGASGVATQLVVVSDVPEPAGLTLMAAGLVGLGMARRRS